MSTQTPPHRRKLKPGEAPTVYLGMRVWDRALKKMVYVKGASVILRNYTVARAHQVLVEAFRQDIEAQKRHLDIQVGHLVKR